MAVTVVILFQCDFLVTRFLVDRLVRLRLTGALRVIRLRVVRLRANKDNRIIVYINTPKYIHNADTN